MKKKVLIVCDMFPPAFAPRMGYLCKFLSQKGWEISVLSEQQDGGNFSFLEDYAQVDTLTYYKKKGKLEWLVKFIFDFLFSAKSNALYGLYKERCRQEEFDVVLSSSYMQFPMSVAYRIAQEKNVPLLIDVRDMIEQYSSSEYSLHNFEFLGLEKITFRIYRSFLKRKRNKYLRRAAALTTVSPFHCSLLAHYNQQVNLIYNGYDPEKFYFIPSKTTSFEIVYTGRILSKEMADPSLLFESLKYLSQDKDFSSALVKVKWYIDRQSCVIVKKLAQQYDVEQYMHYYAYVPAEEIPSILNKSSVVLVLTNKSVVNGPKGILTTKFFEALGMQKPILCVRSDESFLADIIKETGCGVAASTVNEVNSFLIECMDQWKKNNYTQATVNEDQLSIYSRKEQANQFIQLFESLTK